MGLYSDGADYEDEGSSAHPVVISSPRKKKKKPTTPNSIIPLGAHTRHNKKHKCVFPPCSVSLVGKESVSTSNTSAFNAKGTNLWNKGLISADRRTRPTLTLTIPSSLVKSSTKDLSFPTVVIVIQRTRPPPLVRRGRVSQSYDVRPRAILTRFAPGKVNIVAFPAWILT